MEDPIIAVMSEESKRWFAEAIVGMILADGRIDPAEINYLKGVLWFLKDRQLIESTLDLIKKNEAPEIKPLMATKEQAVAIMKHLTSLSIVDEDLAPDEEKFLKSIAEKLDLDDDIYERFVQAAKKKLGGDRFPAQLLFANDSHDVACFGFNENECMFFSDRLINPCARIVLKLYKEKPAEETYYPLSAEAQWCRGSKSAAGKYVVKASFSNRLGFEHGAQLVFSQSAGAEQKKTFSPKHNSLMGFYVQCRICEEKDIPFWQLRTRSLHSVNNIFGIKKYDRAFGDKDFCDYNLYHVSVCPKCLFASNQIEYFQRQDRPIGISMFNKKLLAPKWQKDLPTRLKMVGRDNGWLYGFERTSEQAITSLQLARMTHEQIGLLGDDLEQAEQLRNSVSFLMIEAEMIMDEGKHDEAKKLLYSAKSKLESAFPNLEKETAIRAAFLICMICIYFKEYESVGEYLNFLNNYSRLHNVPHGSSLYKTLNSVLNMVTDAWQGRQGYAHDKLKHFHLP